MQNEFEKQVQQKLEELKLVPSNPVWQKVELQIKKKKEKRRFAFFLLLVGLLLSGTITYRIWTNSNNAVTASKNQNSSSPSKPVNIIKQDIKIENTNAETEQNKNSIQTSTKKNSITQKSLTSESSITDDSKPLAEKRIITQPKAIERMRSFDRIDATKEPFATKKNSLVVLGNKGPENIPLQLQQSQQSQQSQNQISVLKDTTSSKVTADKQLSEKKQTDTPNSSVDTVIKKDKEEIVPQVVTPQNIFKKKIVSSHKWKKTITVQAGWSQFSEGLFKQIFGGGQKSMDYLSSPQSGTGSGGQTLYFPSPVTRGVSFVLGGGIKKIYASRIELSVLMQYHYYSTHMEVGGRKQQATTTYYRADSVSVSGYYTNTKQNNYTNRFGVIEIPVTVGYQLFKNFPLQFSVGASYGRLLRSNTLTFDYNKNIYYYNKDNNSTNFLSIFSSLQYRVLNGNMKVLMGPIFQFNPTELQKENKYTIPHLFFGGLKTNISF